MIFNLDKIKESSYEDSFNHSENIGVDKYLSPVSGKRATIVLPLFSARLANSVAAHTAAPDEIPTSISSFNFFYFKNIFIMLCISYKIITVFFIVIWIKTF